MITGSNCHSSRDGWPILLVELHVQPLHPYVQPDVELTRHSCPPRPFLTCRPACWNCCRFYAVPVAVNAACLLAIGAYTAQSAVSAAELAHIDYVRIATMLAALATFAHRRRRQVRQLEGIPADEAWDDWCSYFCLPQLAVSALCPEWLSPAMRCRDTHTGNGKQLQPGMWLAVAARVCRQTTTKRL